MTKKDDIVKFTQEEQTFIENSMKRKVPVPVIASGFQRKFNRLITPASIQLFIDRGAPVAPTARQRHVESIKDKLPDHNTQLEWLRSVLKSRIETEGEDAPSDATLVKLAAEMRMNIMASQQLATMNDEKGDTQFVLVYGGTVESSSPGADIEDAQFSVLGDDDAP